MKVSELIKELMKLPPEYQDCEAVVYNMEWQELDRVLEVVPVAARRHVSTRRQPGTGNFYEYWFREVDCRKVPGTQDTQQQAVEIGVTLSD